MELLIVIAIMSILASLMLPALKTARDKSKQISCQGSLKQLGLAGIGYVNDNNSLFPISDTDGKLWDYQLMPYLGYPQDLTEANSRQGHSIFHCPSGIPCNLSSYGSNPFRSRGYAYNLYMQSNEDAIAMISRIKEPSKIVLITDSSYGEDYDFIEGFTFPAENKAPYISDYYYAKCITYRHLSQTNVLFADNHVDLCKKGLYVTNKGGWVPVRTKWKQNGIVY